MAGRVRHHLRHNLGRKESSIVFVGYQAEGTLGRKIVDGAKQVEVLGDRITVRAGIHTLGGFSAHADQRELLDWISCFPEQSRDIYRTWRRRSITGISGADPEAVCL